VSDRSPEILILTNERDFGVDEVIRRIDESRVDVRRLNIEAATATSIEVTDIASTGAYPAVRTVWWRQFVANTVYANSQPDDLLVQRAQWAAFLGIFDRPEVNWVNPLWSARRAENKPLQLRAALACGFSVPPTIVTNDRDEAMKFRQQHKTCIVKSLASAYFEHSDHSFVFTEFLTDELLDDAASWHSQPVLVQRFLARERDIRVVAIGDRCFGAQAQSGGSDWRKSSEGVTWHPWHEDSEIEERCLRYLDVMDLRYASFDFVIAEDMTWFLEANQAGEWLFLDKPLELGIARAIAEELTVLAEGNGP
jgi:glutathione synthase/RimK-type ligase-like ATP-grasp enzyme